MLLHIAARFFICVTVIRILHVNEILIELRERKRMEQRKRENVCVCVSVFDIVVLIITLVATKH